VVAGPAGDGLGSIETVIEAGRHPHPPAPASLRDVAVR
jgi:hypothetical protein